MLYKALVKIIQSGQYDREDMLTKLDIYLAGNRLTADQYQELVEMIG